MVNLLRAWKSRHVCHDPSFSKTITIGDEYGLVLGRITPSSSNSCTIFFYFIFLSKWIPVGTYIGGLASWEERDVVIMLTPRGG
jgi:hypothetical protein